ncbi:hypothetical protein BGZ65_007848, partial [Modicella reniformis]
IHKTYTTTIFLIAPSSGDHPLEMGSETFDNYLSSSSSQPLRKRAQPLSASNNNHCYGSEADCQTGTNGCHQHGACVLSSAANCYHCKCSKINTTQYSGPTCDKIDLSIQFHLFFWLGLGLVLAVITAVGLILQMGSQSEGGLPVGPTRAQLKRD